MKLEQLLLIVGLSASGKGRRIRAAFEEWSQSYPQIGLCEDWPGWNHGPTKQTLFTHLSTGLPAIIDCAGFCLPGMLASFLTELRRELPSATCRVEYFDNNPLCSMRLALHDQTRRYGGAGCLARVAQIARDCGKYVIDPQSANVHPVHPCSALVLYTPQRDAWYDEQLLKIQSLLSCDGRALTADDFHVMTTPVQDALIAIVEPAIDAAVTEVLNHRIPHAT